MEKEGKERRKLRWENNVEENMVKYEKKWIRKLDHEENPWNK